MRWLLSWMDEHRCGVPFARPLPNRNSKQGLTTTHVWLALQVLLPNLTRIHCFVPRGQRKSDGGVGDAEPLQCLRAMTVTQGRRRGPRFA